ncbi:unnamed protein product [Symbiodinium natans]|uniref:Pentacotripeptide-repeat region of PRORP domain-containing protein n=1 Tax=Symbiodinium natans TaxID=878477 RepID=A0A812RXA0_9DINO|nr:unnamed protein product [Symbiodinium natans]
MLIQGWARQGNLPNARAWFERMVADGYAPGAGCYTSLISEYCKSGHLRPAESLLAELLRKGCLGKTKTVAYTMLIDAHGKLGNVWEAERLMHSMMESRVEASLVAHLIGVALAVWI